jgi:hypothetical protein
MKPLSENTLIRSLKFIREFWSLPLALIIWWFGGYLILWMDESAALLSLSIFEIPLIATIMLMIAYSVSKLGVLTNYKTIRTWLLSKGFYNDWQSLSASERIRYYLLMQAMLIVVFTIIALSIFARS